MLRLCNKATECTYLRYMYIQIPYNRLVIQTLLKKMAKSESTSCALLYCHSIIQVWGNVETWVRKYIKPYYKMSDWDTVFGNPKSSFIINAIIFNTKKVIYMNRQTGKEMLVDC